MKTTDEYIPLPAGKCTITIETPDGTTYTLQGTSDPSQLVLTFPLHEVRPGVIDYKGMPPNGSPSNVTANLNITVESWAITAERKAAP